MGEAQAIKPSRKKWGIAGVALVWLGVGAVAKSVSAGNTAGAVLAGLFLVVPGCYALSLALRNRARFVLDTTGLTIGSGRRVPWSQIQAVHVATHQGLFGEDHSLIVKLLPAAGSATSERLITTNETANDELDLPLDGMSVTWDEAVQAVERFSGMPVKHTREGAFGRRLPE